LKNQIQAFLFVLKILIIMDKHLKVDLVKAEIGNEILLDAI
jgi:hypothetical protein